MGYENATSTKLLATHCCYCGRALRDADSVERGIGPVCRGKIGEGPDTEPQWDDALFHTISSIWEAEFLKHVPSWPTFHNAIESRDVRAACNWLIHFASVVYSHGERTRCHYGKLVMAISSLGYPNVAKILAHRKYQLRIFKDGDVYHVHVPRNDIFYHSVFDRRIGRWDKKLKSYTVPVAKRQELWQLLQHCFDGECGISDRGQFEVTK